MYCLKKPLPGNRDEEELLLRTGPLVLEAPAAGDCLAAPCSFGG